MSNLCKRCNGRAVYIGISGSAELVCVRDCAGRCPGCLSFQVEPFVTYSYWGFVPPTTTSQMHCIACGAVWAMESK